MGARNSRNRRPGGGMGGGGGGGGGGRRGGRRRGRNRGGRPGEGGPAPWGAPDPNNPGGGGYPPAGTYAAPGGWETDPLAFDDAGAPMDGATAAGPAREPMPPSGQPGSAPVADFGAGIAGAPQVQRSDQHPMPQPQMQQQRPERPPTEPMKAPGLLELMQDGFGFLRFAQNNYLPDADDIYVPASLVRRYRIRPGSMILGEIMPARKPGQKPALATITSINDRDPELHAQ